MIASLHQVLFLIFGLFLVPWALIFGGAGGVLACTRGGSWPIGAMWGVCLGPAGWGVVWFRTRNARRASMAQWADESLTGPAQRLEPIGVTAPLPPPEDEPRRGRFL